MYCVRKVNEDYTWIGADSRRLAVFEGVFGVPEGVSYNSYLLLDEKTVLFDTVDAQVIRQFRENLLHKLSGRTLDYIVVHHMEPDHTAELEDLVLRFPEVQILCTAMAKTMIGQFFGHAYDDRIHVCKEGDTLCTGRHTLQFVMAPMVHWPEVMMTYDRTDKLLLSADAFGCFGALNGHLYADEVDFDRDYLDECRRYYTNIVGKYGSQVQAVLQKAAGLEIRMILPLHGFVWRRDLEYILGKHDLWSRYEPEVQGVMIAYASVYGNTENAANILACRLAERGVKVKLLLDVRERSIVVPRKALSIEKGGAFIYIIRRDDIAEKRFVQTGPEIGNKVVIERGLGENERVVVEGYHKLVPGVKVHAVEAGDEKAIQALREEEEQ